MDKKKIGKVLYRLFDGLLNLILLAFGVVVLWLLLQVSSIATFRIPTDSMEPALTAGDNILVNKWVMGARIFNLWDAAEGKDVKIRRLPAFGRIRRNDVLVFNFPYPAAWDSIGLDLLKYYVKRCVALPGDSFEIRRCRYGVRGSDEPLGNVASQERLARLMESGCDREYGIVTAGYPHHGMVDWNIADFGPLYIPAAGSSVRMDALHALLYRNLIEWEQRKKLVCRGDTVWLGDSIIRRYRFRENYYFVAGDRVANSQDSRYWGLLPEPFIVGKAVRIWKSVDPLTGKVRWDRVWKRIE